jgi:hypothetical protein
VALAHRCEDRPVGGDQRLNLGREGLAEPACAAAPFLRPLGRVGLEVVEPGAGMGVDRPDGAGLTLRWTRMRVRMTCFITSAKLPA